MQIIDFYKLSNANISEPELEGTIVISESEGIEVTVGGEEFKQFVLEEIKSGLPAFPLIMDRRKKLKPEDGLDFIKRLQMRFSGGQFWAHLREEE